MAKKSGAKKKPGDVWRKNMNLGKLSSDERPQQTYSDGHRDSWEPRRSVPAVDPRRL